jgi:putative serine protease PepD
MPGEFDFFDDEPKPAPKPKPAPRPLPPPQVESESEIEFEPTDEDDPPMAAPVARRPRVEEAEKRPRHRGREPADPRKKPSALLIAGIIVGSLVLLGGATAGIMIALGGKSKPTEPKDKPVAATTLRSAKATTPAPPVDPDKPSPAVVERVKKATVYIRCAFKNGEGGTGSGFVVKDSGLVVTNAHVIGLKEEKFKGPRAIELVFNSGEGPDKEYHYGGELVAFDREQDLAILRPFIIDVGARQAVPDGITVSKTPNLSLLQKLFVFGFPLGESIGKEITVSETSISSLRKDPETGKLKMIQVKGGITHGNSGGPLVDLQGNVVGVAVAEYTGTDIRLAIPSEVVQEFIAKHKK